MVYQAGVATPNKRAINLTLPIPVMDKLEEIARDLKSKQKWMVHTAAMLAFLDLPEDQRSTLIKQVASADLGIGSFDELLEIADKGELLKLQAKISRR